MNHLTDDLIRVATLKIAARYVIGKQRTHDCLYHGQGLFEIGEYSVLAEIKAAVQEIDYKLIVTSMVYLPNGNLFVNFDRFI